MGLVDRIFTFARVYIVIVPLSHGLQVNVVLSIVRAISNRQRDFSIRDSSSKNC